MSSEFHINYRPICDLYSQEQLTGTLYLAFRDIPQILQRYALLDRQFCIKALDFGCGAGTSTRYLQSLGDLFQQGIDVTGIDVSSDMLNLAYQSDPRGNYHLLHNHQIPTSNEFYDFIFSSFVLFEFATKEKMQQSLQEIKRVMKKNALFIAVTGSAEAYQRENQWVSLKVDFSQNNQLKSGDLGRIDFVMHDIPITFQNYYWTEQDYQDVFQAAGLSLCETHHPLGYQEEEILLSWQWKSEMILSPYYIFVLKAS